MGYSWVVWFESAPCGCISKRFIFSVLGVLGSGLCAGDFAEAWWKILRFDSLALRDQAAYHGICTGGVGKSFSARQFFLKGITEVRLLGRKRNRQAERLIVEWVEGCEL